jgi:hypothetical protein
MESDSSLERLSSSVITVSYEVKTPDASAHAPLPPPK